MILIAICTAILVTVLFLVALRPLALAVRLVDVPGGRKHHVGEVPIIGGACMFAGLLFGFSLLPAPPPDSLYLVVSAALLVSVGVLDDRFHIPASARFVAQFTVVLLMAYGADLRLYTLGDPIGTGDIGLGPLSFTITALVTMTVINAFNLVDGVDGLAGTLALLCLGAAAVLGGYESGYAGIALLGMAVVASFLLFNWPTVWNRPVRTFMGDAGSTLLGLLAVWVVTRLTQGETAVTSPVIGLWFAAIPIFDLFTAFVRRIRRGDSPFRPGRDHFHHTLHRSGMSIRHTLAVLTGLQAVYCILGLLGHYAGTPDAVMFPAWAFFGITQLWVIRKYAALYRADTRRRRDRKPLTNP